MDFGHPTGMGTPAELLARIQKRMLQMDLSEDQVGRLAGHRDSVRNFRRSVEKGTSRGPSDEIVAAIAGVLKCAPSWLRGEPGASEPPIPVAGLRAKLAEQAEIDRQKKALADREAEVRAAIEALRAAEKTEMRRRKTKNR